MMRKIVILSFIILIIALGIAWVAASQGLSITWWSVDGGGGVLETEDYAIIGIIGEPEGGGSVGNGTYSVSGGFFPGDESVPIITGVYLPLLIGGE